MVKLKFVITLCFVSIQGVSQEFQKETILRASASYSIGNFTKMNQSVTNLGTSLEYYIDEHFSLRGEGVYFLGYINDVNLGFKSNHGLMAGLSYHFTEKKAFDPYIGLQPGMNFGKYGNLSGISLNNSYWLSNNQFTNFHANPTLSFHTGFNYYAEKYFHLFIDVRYLYGNFHSEIPTISLNEFRIEFGLGFNLRLKKENSTNP